MARKGAKKASAAAGAANRTSKNAELEEPVGAAAAQPSLADELSSAHDDTAHQEGYESSTHTDNDDFEDAADGSHGEEITPSSSAATADNVNLDQDPKAEEVAEQEEDLSRENTADQPLARRPSSAAVEGAEGQVQTPKATDASFPDAPEAPASSVEADDKESTAQGIAASSSAATFIAPSTADADPVAQDTPLSSAEIRDSQSASDSLILDEESAKATLPDHVEKVPPSVGATSLLEPDETISNPFASSDEPIKYSQTAAGGDHTASTATHPPDTPSINSNHFSIVSLGSGGGGGQAEQDDAAAAGWSDAAKRDSRRDTITTNGARSSLAEHSNDSELARNGESSSNYDFLLARLDTQNKRLSGDPKQMRASIDGAVKLREHFEKLRDQGKRHSRTDSQNRALAQEEGGASSSHDTHASKTSLNQPPVNGAAAAAGQRESVTSSAGTAWEGPPAEDIGDEEIDWEFWGDVMSNYQQVARNHPRQLSRAIQAGIPPALRGMMWQLMSSSKNEEMEIIYAYYLKQTSSHEKAIRRDLNRTFPEQDYFQDGKGIGQENLFNVIKAYSLYDPEVGYCQGMQFVVGPLLLNMPDEEAFSTFVRLMKSYDLRGHFTPNMPALQLRLFQFDRLLEDFLPLLHRHLVRQGVKSSMYASQWFMTLFSYRFPLDFVYRILDSVFAEGVEALFRFAIALMKKNEERLLEMHFDKAVEYLKMELFECYRRSDSGSGRSSVAELGDATATAVPSGQVRTSTQSPTTTTSPSSTSANGNGASSSKPRYRTNEFVRDAFDIKITPFILDTYAGEFDVQVRAANAHRREVEALRLVNRNLAARVKALEEQLNSVNAEHVEMVKDVVMAKIAKEEMAEELVKYKMMYAEAVLAADQESAGNRSSAAGMAAAARRAAERDSAGSGSGGGYST
ncbi:related to GYP5 - GTPase-activating protein (GAP) [Ustilago trichophora]|uniref:Related to GYP5 - GTPase-activating protein (GAP) n=1 Tax=Ustilago trichophora TaxID=86804 RepID=A0A5C3EDA3_9BASI|nr:related to GYP5 - GTPase-activating protein (GAP) [Ustilago trichophora]